MRAETRKKLGIILLLIIFVFSISSCDMLDDFAGGEASVTRTGSINGIIIDEQENSLNGVQVTVGNKTASTRSDGSYFIEDLEVGDYNLTASLEGYEDKSVQITVEDGSNSIEKLQMSREDEISTGDIKGVIIDENEDPMKNVEIMVNNKTDFTDDDGSFLIKGVEVGEHTLTAYYDQYQEKSKTITIEEGEKNVGQIQMEAANIVSDVDELEKELNNLEEDDEAVIILKPGKYESRIKIDDEYQFSKLTIAAEEKHEATITEGIKLINTNNVTLSGLEIINEADRAEVGIGAWHSNNVSFKQNFIEGFDKFGLYVTSYSGNRDNETEGKKYNANIRENEIVNESKGGIHIQGSEIAADLKDNIINNCLRGVWIDRGAEAVIKNNEFNENIISLYLTEISEDNFIAQNNNIFAQEFDINKTWMEDADICENLEKLGYVYVMAENKDMDNNLKQIRDSNDFKQKSDFVNIETLEYYYKHDFESEGVILGSLDKEVEEGLFEVKSKPEEGFHWNYFLYIPETFSRENSADYTNHMLVIQNYPEVSDDPDVFQEAAKSRIKLKRRIPQELGIPVLVPAYPRPETIDGAPEPAVNHFTNRLDRNTLSLHLHDGVKEKYHRIDKQIGVMIDHALDILAENDISLSEQVFMYGFSATAHFANRFIKIHPERVQASVSGGIAVITLPEYHRNEVDLNFPVGVYDLDELADTQFDIDAYQNIPQFIFRGKEDYDGGPLAATNTIDDTEREKYEEAVETKAVGDDLAGTDEARQIFIDRILKVEEIYNENDVPAQFKLYEGVEHEMTSEIWDDVIEFFKNNADNELDEI